MTDRQLAKLAAAAARRTTVTYKTWLKNKRDGKYPDDGALTAWGELFAYLDQIGAGATPPPAPVPTSTLAQQAAHMVFCAHRSEAALQAPAGWPVALTVDPSYSAWLTPSIVSQFRSQGRRVHPWIVQTQVDVGRAVEIRDSLKLDQIIFQGETSEEYQTARAAGAQIIIGNPNAWTDAQKAEASTLINTGQLAVIGECYTNLGGPWPNSYSADGVPICSICIGVYDGSSEVPGQGWYPTVAGYRQNCPPELWKTVGVYHAAGLRPEDWQALA